MKIKLVIMTTVMLVLVQMVVGQKIDSKEMAKYQNEIMFERLDLSEKQQDKIMAHNSAFSEKQAALMNREGSMFSKMGEMKKMKKEKKAELQNILSKEQMEIFEDELAPKIRSYMRGKMKG